MDACESSKGEQHSNQRGKNQTVLPSNRDRSIPANPCERATAGASSNNLRKRGSVTLSDPQSNDIFPDSEDAPIDEEDLERRELAEVCRQQS